MSQATATTQNAQSDRPTFDSLDPRNGDVIASYPIEGAEQVAAAVARARQASVGWAALGFEGRAKVLAAWRRRLVSKIDELASVISRETGKPTDDALLELVLTVDHLAWAGKNAKRVLKERGVSAGLLMSNQKATVSYPPFGVVGVIGPWNYPVFTPMGSIAYALAAGNAVVFKPSEYTPGVGAWLVDSFAAVAPDPSVFRLLTGLGETGAALCRSGVDKLAFTGSGATGRRVMAACSENLTPVLIECGGKDPLIVDSDADLAAAADAAVWGGMSNAGQTCVGVERVYVVDSVADEFLDLVRDKAAALHSGGQAGADFGPMTMPSQVDVVSGQVRDAIAAGARAVVGGVESVRAPFIEPIVLADVPETSTAITQETFGPLLTVNRVPDVDEAVRRANATSYGLGASVFSKRNGRRIAEQLRCGMVAVNGVIAFAGIPSLPFGGVGESGFGRIHGDDGLREFARPHSIASQRFKPPIALTTFGRGDKAMPRTLKLVKLLYGR